MVVQQFVSARSRRTVFLGACTGYAGVGGLALFQLLQHAMLIRAWPLFLVTTLISLAFFGVGGIVWWYGRKRRVASLFFLASGSLACSLWLVTPLDYVHERFADTISSLSILVGLFFLLLFFLYFPRPLLGSWKGGDWRTRLLWIWLSMLAFLDGCSALFCLTNSHFPPPALFDPWYLVSFLAPIASILGVLLVATQVRLSRRERQQLRLLFAGISIGFVPMIGLALFPELLHDLFPLVQLPEPGNLWTVPPLGLLPLSIGYTILRYQFLVYDTVVARAVTWVLRGISLLLCGYLGLVTFLLCPSTPLALILWATLLVGLSIGAWSLARRIARFLLFAEAEQDRQQIMSALEMSAQTNEVSTIIQAIRYLVTLTCGSQDAFLLLRDEASGLYRLAEPLAPPATARLEQVLGQILEHRYPAPPIEELAVFAEAQTHLTQAHRPSFLWELTHTKQITEQRSSDAAQMLLVGLPDADQLLGILVLDVRVDQQPYAGADFDTLRDLIRRVVPALAASIHHTTQTTQRQALEEALRQTVQLGRLAAEDFTTALVQLVARFVPAQIELWEQREHVWQRLAMAGTHRDVWATEQTRHFLSQKPAHPLPLFAPHGLDGHPLPVMLLPLEEEPSHTSRLLAQYHRPNRFLQERRELLTLVARHAERMLREARSRGSVVGEARHTLSSTLVLALRSFLDAVPSVDEASASKEAQEAFVLWARQRHLEQHWQSLQMLLPLWPRATQQEPWLSAAPGSLGTILLVMNHPLLADILTRACAWRGCPVVVQPTLRDSLDWLQRTPQRLQAIVVDEDLLSLDLNLFIHVLLEYVPHLPLVIVCSARNSVPETALASVRVASLPKPFTLTDLFHLLEWT